MTEHDHLARLEDLVADRDRVPLADPFLEAIAWAVETIRDQAEEVNRLREALEKMVAHYCELANSGDCGWWNPEDEDVIKVARAALDGKGDRG